MASGLPLRERMPSAAALLVRLTEEGKGLPRVCNWQLYGIGALCVRGQTGTDADVQVWAEHLGGTVTREPYAHDPLIVFVSVLVQIDGLPVEIWTSTEAPKDGV